MRIGILALQGAFIEHQKVCDNLQVESFYIKHKEDLVKPFDGLILPGGESTAMAKMIKDLDLYIPLQTLIKKGLPVFGTCAGMILLAKNISYPHGQTLQTMDIEVVRNGYGRQLGSFTTIDTFKGIGDVPMVFIRAPYIATTSDAVEIIAIHNNRIVAAKQNNQLAVAFHPELSNDTRIHQYFIDMIQKPTIK